MLAAAVNDILLDVIQRLHIGLMQIDHDDIRFLAFRKNVTVMKPHGSCPIHCSHLKHLFGIHRRGILFPKLGKPCCQEHLTEHIQAVIAGSAVGSDTHINAFFQETGNRCNPACKLCVGSGIGDYMKPFPCKEIHIFLCKVNTMITASAVIEQPQGIQELRRGHPVTLQTFIRFCFCLRYMRKKRRFVFMDHFGHLLQ